MPSVSDAQRRALYAKKGSAWVHAHHFDVVDPRAAGAAHAKRRHKKRRARR